MSNILNQFSASALTKENSEAPKVAIRAVYDEDQGCMITITRGTRDTVKSRINKLKEGKAPEDDGLTPIFLKSVAGMVGIVGFNVQLDTLKVISEWQRKCQSLWLRYLTGLLMMLLSHRIGKW